MLSHDESKVVFLSSSLLVPYLFLQVNFNKLQKFFKNIFFKLFDITKLVTIPRNSQWYVRRTIFREGGGNRYDVAGLPYIWPSWLPHLDLNMIGTHRTKNRMVIGILWRARRVICWGKRGSLPQGLDSNPAVGWMKKLVWIMDPIFPG